MAVLLCCFPTQQRQSSMVFTGALLLSLGLGLLVTGLPTGPNASGSKIGTVYGGLGEGQRLGDIHEDDGFAEVLLFLKQQIEKPSGSPSTEALPSSHISSEDGFHALGTSPERELPSVSSPRKDQKVEQPKNNLIEPVPALNRPLFTPQYLQEQYIRKLRFVEHLTYREIVHLTGVPYRTVYKICGSQSPKLPPMSTTIPSVSQPQTPLIQKKKTERFPVLIPNISNADQKEIQKLAKKGVRHEKIAKQFGISIRNVRRVIKQLTQHV